MQGPGQSSASSASAAGDGKAATPQIGVPEQVASDIYRICVPLPDNPLRTLNSYVIAEGERPLVVDLGFDLPECYEALTRGLHSLDISWEDVDVLFTHGHPDHCGMINRVARPKTTFYAGFRSFYDVHEEYHVHNRGFLAWLRGGYELLPKGCIFPPVSEQERRQILNHAIDYSSMGGVAIPHTDIAPQLLRDGDCLVRGKRRFQVIGTTGHSPSHRCLYDPSDKLLICGDQLLARITPVIVSFSLGETVLADYIGSTRALAEKDCAIALTGHRQFIEDVPKRAAELIEHHRQRSSEILHALSDNPVELVTIAKAVTWRSPIPNWDDWPLKQKYFSLGETLSHLSDLESRGLVDHEIEGESIRFKIKQ